MRRLDASDDPGYQTFVPKENTVTLSEPSDTNLNRGPEGPLCVQCGENEPEEGDICRWCWMNHLRSLGWIKRDGNGMEYMDGRRSFVGEA